MTHLSPLDAARLYVQERGFCVVPNPRGEKNPMRKGWQNLRLTVDELPNYFNGQPQNIGVHVGEPSNNLGDVDIDANESLPIAYRFLPETAAISGRTSRPRSHYFYALDREVFIKFLDPIREKSDDESERKKATLVELRAKQGHQTLLPPSEHSGEVVSWDVEGAPASISADELLPRVKRLSAATLLARYWPDGARHEASLALFGGLLRAGWGGEDARDFIEAVCVAARDDETRARLRNGETTEQRLEEGDPVTGWPTLSKIFDKRIVYRVYEWLEIKSDSRTQAHSLTWDDPEPLPDDLLTVPAFNERLLPFALRSWLTDIAERKQCPIEFPSVTALILAACLIGSRIRIRPKRKDDWTVVPNLWGATVGKPGVLKTPASDEAFKPLKPRESLARAEYQKALQEYEFECAYAEARRNALKRRMQQAKDEADKESFRTEYSTAKLPPPIERRYVTNDPTTEKLGEILNQNPRGVLLYRDELTGWFRSLDREWREKDRSFFLETWGGYGSYTYDRIGRGTLRIENLTLSIFGTIQPGPLTHYLRGALRGGYGDDGLMQRFQLLVYPDPQPKWRNVDRDPNAEAARQAHEFFAKLDLLEASEVGTHLVTSVTANAEYSFLRFDHEAQEFFDAWRTDLETSLRSGAFEHPALEAHMAKYRSLMPSLALIFHLMDRVCAATDSNSVTLDAAQRAAAWCTLLEAHARRVYGLALNADVQGAKAILEHIRRGDLRDEFMARDVYSKHWAGLATAKDVAEPLTILEDYGWLRSFILPGAETGGRPTARYLTHPSLQSNKQEGAS